MAFTNLLKRIARPRRWWSPGPFLFNDAAISNMAASWGTNTYAAPILRWDTWDYASFLVDGKVFTVTNMAQTEALQNGWS